MTLGSRSGPFGPDESWIRTSDAEGFREAGAVGGGERRVARPLALSLSVLAAAITMTVLSFAWVDAPAARFASSALSAYRGPARYVTDLGLSGYMLVGSALVAAAAFLMRRREPRADLRQGLEALMERALFVFAAVAVSGLLAQAVKHLVGRARPKLIDSLGTSHFDFFAVKASLASFPSGHATSVFALATALALIAPRWRWPLFAFAVVVSASRFVVGAHYVSDIVAGGALGCTVALGTAVAFAGWSVAFRRVGPGLYLKDDHAVGPVIRTLARRARSAS